MHRRILFFLLSGLLLTALFAAPSNALGKGGKNDGGGKNAPWTPPMGATFNNPVGSKDGQHANVDRVIKAVKETPKGETIRLAMYSFDIKRVADALLDARKRGVRVQMIVNDNWTSPQTARLRKKLGKNIHKNNFVQICHGSCRGGKGNLHLKVYAFSKTGDTSKFLITGSSNLTDRAERLQWNDVFSMQDDGLYDTFMQIFKELKKDKRTKPRWVSYSSDQVKANFYRTKDGRLVRPAPVVRTRYAQKLNRRTDPVLKRLQDVDCKTGKGYGLNGHTVIRIAMYAWNGERGKYLADQVAQLKRQGCKIRTILSVPGGGVVLRLRNAGVEMRSADWNYLPTGVVNFYSHLKVMTLSGTYKGKKTRTIWTGSENWSPMSFLNDELTIELSKKSTYDAYLARFNSLWADSTHPMGQHPSGKPARG